MADKNIKKRGGRLFKPGVSGNPQGSSKKAKSNKKIRQLTNQQVAEVGSLLLDGNFEMLRNIISDPKTSVLQAWMASLIGKSVKSGDAQTFKVLMERICGRIKESVELTGKDGAALNMNMSHSTMTYEEKVARADALAATRRIVEED